MYVRYRCPAARIVIDRGNLWRDGTHALYLDPVRGIRAISVAQTRGRRPWVNAKAHGEARFEAAGTTSSD